MVHFCLKRQYRSLFFFILFGFIRESLSLICTSGNHVGSNDACFENDGVLGRQYLSTSYSFACCGLVSKWELHAGRPGTVHLQVWRDVDGAGTYTLVGQNTISIVWFLGATEKSLQPYEQIFVKPGDLIGWYSDDADIINYYSQSGSGDGKYAITNTVPRVGGSLTALSNSFSGRKYSIKAVLEPDNKPEFQGLSFSEKWSHSTAVGEVVHTVVAFDPDDDGNLTMTLDSVTPAVDFALESSTGEVTVLNTLVALTSYVLTVTVTDTCGNTATTTVTVTATNEPPTILNLPNTVEVTEAVKSAMLFYTLTTHDDDGDDVTCDIYSSIPPDSPFEMRSINNGSSLIHAVYVQANPGFVNRAASLYILDINCTDGYESTKEGINPLYIAVIQNEMAIFLNLQNNTTVDINENMGTTVFTVRAKDAERDTLTFSLSCTSASSSCPFAIYSNGAILLTSSLVGTSDLAYEVDITAYDGYSVTDAHRLTVFISGLNSAPELSNLPQTVQITEDTSSGASLFQVTVFDLDGDSYDVTLTYSPSIGASVFSFNETSLELSLAEGETLDYESVTQYQVSVTADDGKLTSVGELTLNVVDVNESPLLLTEIYYVYQDEGTMNTSFNGQPNLQTSDPDTGDSLTHTLDISAQANTTSIPSSYCHYLQVNSVSGDFSYAIDYDVDDPALSSLFTCLLKIEDTGGLSVTATVSVSIQDINDNNPQFTSSAFFFSISQSASLGTTVGVVEATDADVSSVHSQLEFSMAQTSQYFHLSPDDGVVTLKYTLNDVSLDTVVSDTLYVRNTGSLSQDTAILRVTVVGGGDGFWDKAGNIAWVTVTILGVVAFILVLAFSLYKLQPWKKAYGHRALKVKPSSRPSNGRESFESESPSLPSTSAPRPSAGIVSLSDIPVQKQWNAWSQKRWRY